MSGREITNLIPTPKRFRGLEKGRDYEMLKVNKKVQSNRPIEDFVVFVDPSGGDQSLTVVPPHWRTVTAEGIEASTIISASDGEQFTDLKIPYYSVNTKGVGYLKPSVRRESLDTYETWMIPEAEHEEGRHAFGTKVLGMMSKGEEYYNNILDLIPKSQYLIEQGLRGEVYWGIARLKNVYYKGLLTPIEELKKQGVVPPHSRYQALMAVRLLKTNNRIAQARRSEETRGQLFKEAFEIFNKETHDRQLGFPDLEINNGDHQRIFFKEFFRRMGGNMATLLNCGYVSGYIHSANITLAAEIVDFEAMNYWKNHGEPNAQKLYNGVRHAHIKDMRDVTTALHQLRKAGRDQGLHTGKRQELIAACLEGFDGEADLEKIVREGTDLTQARRWLSAILIKVLDEREHLPALRHSEIEDWGITLAEK